VLLPILVGWLVYSCCSHLEPRASVKRFVSLQFLNLRQSVRPLGQVISQSQGRYLTQTQKKHRQTSIPQVGFEPMIPVFKRAKTVHALNSAATVIGLPILTFLNYQKEYEEKSYEDPRCVTISIPPLFCFSHSTFSELCLQMKNFYLVGYNAGQWEKSADVSKEHISFVFKIEDLFSFLFHAGFFCGSYFDPEDGGGMFLWNVSWLPPDYTALYLRRQKSF
jgi:hypothetical protein